MSRPIGSPNNGLFGKDLDRNKWLDFVTRQTSATHSGLDVILEKDVQEYEENYNVRFLPKYMLIDAQGLIIHSNLPEPSFAVEQLIEQELKKM